MHATFRCYSYEISMVLSLVGGGKWCHDNFCWKSLLFIATEHIIYNAALSYFATAGFFFYLFFSDGNIAVLWQLICYGNSLEVGCNKKKCYRYDNCSNIYEECMHTQFFFNFILFFQNDFGSYILWQMTSMDKLWKCQIVIFPKH